MINIVQSWNVYNPASIARVKADEAAAAAREAADEERMQELDAERRAAILRGQTPPPLPENVEREDKTFRKTDKGRDGHDRKRRRLAGEDDTDAEIRLARTVTGAKDEDNVAILKLRNPKSDAPLTDHAGNINLFPVDLKEAGRREKNAEAEKEKKKKEQAYEDQYTMRFSNAAGKDGLEQRPWYAAADTKAIEESGFGSKDVWGREDPGRKDRSQARMTSSDPLAFMNRAQVQLKQARIDRKKWAEERDQELMELRAAQERESRRSRHSKRKQRNEDDDLESFALDHRHHKRDESLRHRHSHSSRTRTHEQRPERKTSHRSNSGHYDKERDDLSSSNIRGIRKGDRP